MVVNLDAAYYNDFDEDRIVMYDTSSLQRHNEKQIADDDHRYVSPTLHIHQIPADMINMQIFRIPCFGSLATHGNLDG